MTVLVGGTQGRLSLGRSLGKGGEGAVFEIAGRPELVAKIYHQPPDHEKYDKLVAMVRGDTPRLRSIAAWPVDTLHDRGGLRGFVMPRLVRHRDIHVLYGPKTRLRECPEASYRFLVHVAANMARAFAVIHEHGHVIGDVNQGSVCVSARGTVTFVDCDSFQVRGANGLFCCDVATPIYQPPELQQITSFRGKPRSQNHDLFGLAVLLFQLLFLGRHPFAGAYQGRGDMPIERAIQERRFAYAGDAAKRLMRQPRGSLGLGTLPPAISAMFERAFLRLVGPRPTASEWHTALDDFGGLLRDCAKNNGHAYLRSLSSCPLCALEAAANATLFVPVRVPRFDVEPTWRELEAIFDAARIPEVSLDIPLRRPSQAILAFESAQIAGKVIRWVGGVVSGALGCFVHPSALLGAIVSLLFSWLASGVVPEEAKHVRERHAAARARLAQAAVAIEQARVANPLVALETQARMLYQRLAHPHLPGRAKDIGQLMVIAADVKRMAVPQRERVAALFAALEQAREEVANVQAVVMAIGYVE